jgi:hypothetical protein
MPILDLAAHKFDSHILLYCTLSDFIVHMFCSYRTIFENKDNGETPPYNSNLHTAPAIDL